MRVPRPSLTSRHLLNIFVVFLATFLGQPHQIVKLVLIFLSIEKGLFAMSPNDQQEARLLLQFTKALRSLLHDGNYYTDMTAALSNFVRWWKHFLSVRTHTGS